MSCSEEKKHIAKLKRGDQNSFDWIYEMHYQNVYNFCNSFTKSAADAEELTTDAFVTIWKKRQQLDPERSIKPLLFKVTKDLTWNFLRKTSKLRSHRALYLQNYTPLEGDSSDSEILYKEYENKLLGLLEKLTPQQQKIFTLKYFKGKNLNQIAKELAISKNTVKSHLAKSKQFMLNHIPSLGVLLLLLKCFY